MNQQSKKLTWTFVTLLVMFFLFWGAKTYSENYRVKAEKELDHVHGELQVVVDVMNQPYLFPLDNRSLLQNYASFNTSTRFPNLHHAAIDYRVEPGSPVYAVADGVVSFSGEMDGYAGLVVIDHSKESLYSLYGHLSLKSDMVELGSIKRGDIVGYIAEPSESYGIGTVSHLHFALRLGEKADYPSSGDERWMAGYTERHPIFSGFIDPERFILQTVRWNQS
ncbi:M23 family metallopeptidase [Vibrio vulnificus]|uniref:M23 family metallopeptidase n=1 Tax=Vibrio vulnificus TaxID=672 RepID=UPI001CDD5841|nr:M23 family metallopeptidase [Vibrio vulnificus]MCA3910264.1 M23 family metallopeptidase [Vibrio vulnificus]